MTGSLLVTVDGPVMTVSFNRPEARNAMTWEMYDGLVAACHRAEADEDVRVLVLRGVGDAFVAGTDITQFAAFGSGADGVAYEARVHSIVQTVERVDVVTLAAVRGACVGGGLALAAACDLRVADESARFGVPIARTLGNCLSQDNVRRLVSTMGAGAAAEMLLMARLLPAARMHELGFLQDVVPGDELDGHVEETARRLAGLAPLTLQVSRQMLDAARRGTAVTAEDELIARVYGSEDFAEGVQAFTERRTPRWNGR